MEEFPGDLPAAALRDEVAERQADGLRDGGCVDEEIVQAEGRRVGDGVGFRDDGPAGGAVVVGLEGFGQAGFLVFAADPPGEGAAAGRGVDGDGGKMDLHLRVSRAAADALPADQRHGTFALGRVGDGLRVVAGDEPGEEAVFLGGAVVAGRDGAALRVMVGALPAFPDAEQGGIVIVEDVGACGDAGVGPGVALEFADGEDERHAGVRPGFGGVLAAVAGAQGDGRQAQQADDEDGQEDEEGESDDEGEATPPTAEGGTGNRGEAHWVSGFSLRFTRF